MHITNISLRNWKNFAGVDVECGMRVFIIGANAAGKSNLLDALRFLKDVTRHGLTRAVVDIRGGLPAVRSINARSKPDVTVSIALDSGWKYSLSFGGKSMFEPVVIREVVADGTGRVVLDRPDRDDESDPRRLSQTALEQVHANREFREIADFLSTIEYRHVLPQLVREPESFSPKPVSNDPFGRDLVFTIWKTLEKTRNARLKRINDVLRAAVPNLKDLRVVSHEGEPHFEVNYEHWRKSGMYISEAELSDGTLRLIALLWAVLDTGGPLLLEEPELSLHEGIVAKLPGFFARVEREKKKAARQLFITTHSDALLRDPGIGADEILILVPGKNGVEIAGAGDTERRAMNEGGLSAADILLPRTRPENIDRMERAR